MTSMCVCILYVQWYVQTDTTRGRQTTITVQYEAGEGLVDH